MATTTDLSLKINEGGKIITFSTNTVKAKISVKYAELSYSVAIDGKEVKDPEKKERILSIVRTAEFHLNKIFTKLSQTPRP